ncbi:hypothetical protein EDD11_008661 [Mortierella claussenii]|nr:hypothetical protein EDD11_008661 [Mortierella claussenii]
MLAHRVYFDGTTPSTFAAKSMSKCNKLWAKLTEAQIQSMDTSGHLRLRLQQKLHVQSNTPIFARLFGELTSPLTEREATSGIEGHFGVHYMELERFDADLPAQSSDYIVDPPGEKLQILDAKSCQQQQRLSKDMPQFARTAQIFAIDTSASGSCVAVLSATVTTAYIGLWNLESALPLQPSGASGLDAKVLELHHSSITSQTPAASTAFPLQAGDFDSMRHVRIACSTDGTTIAVYQIPTEEDDEFGEDEKDERGISIQRPNFEFPFRLFHFRSTLEDPKEIQDVFEYPTTTSALVEDRSIDHALSHFLGYGKFMARDQLISEGSEMSARADKNGTKGWSKGDYFIACSESRINLYDTSTRPWKPLYGIAIGGLSSMDSRSKQLRTLFKSIQGPSFVWWEDLQNVSIWDLATGANRKYISVNGPHLRSQQNEIEHISVSMGGKLLVLAGKNWIRTYFMDSGIEICNTFIRDGRVLDVQFLDEEKSLMVTMIKSATGKGQKLEQEQEQEQDQEQEQVAVLMDALNLSFQHCSMKQFAMSTYTVQQVTRLSPRVAEAMGLSSSMDQYVIMAVNGNELEVFAIPQPGINSPGGRMVHCPDGCAMSTSLQLDQHFYHPPGSTTAYRLIVDFEEREQDSRIDKVVRVVLVAVNNHGSVEQLMTIIPEPWNLMDVDEENALDFIQASFLANWAQFIIVTAKGFQVWSLPDQASGNRCELSLSWLQPRAGGVQGNEAHPQFAEQILETRVCIHGESIRPMWFDDKDFQNQTTCIRIPKSNWSTRAETMYCINSVPMLLSCYNDASVTAQDAIIRHIIKYINQDPPEGTTNGSIMSRIAWTSRWDGSSKVLSALFNSTDGKWVPRRTSTYNGRTGDSQSWYPINPIFLLVKNAKKEPRSLPLAIQMVDYCIREAKSQRDPAFLMLVLDCLPVLVVYHPDTAIDIIRQMAFIPVKDRDFVVNNSVVAHSPRLAVEMSNAGLMKRRRPIHEYPNSVFQLKSQLPRLCAKQFSIEIEVASQRVVDPLNETFKRHIYVAPYALLWHRKREIGRHHVRGDRDSDATTDSATNMDHLGQTSYARMLLGMIWGKMNPWSQQTVRANFMDLLYFDNPAIEALLEYKWNTYACIPWLLRFLGQLLYYALVLTVTLIQVYPHMSLVDLRIPLIAIIALGGMFLYLELQQLLADYWKYLRTPYNVIDVMVFLLPVLGSIQLLITIPEDRNESDLGNSRLLSFSILLIYTHLLFELRVNRSVCNIVTIILRIVVKIRVFFFIFALSIMAFTHSTIHLLLAKNHDCLTIASNGNALSGPEYCAERETDFPSNYVGAISATYFMLAGRYDFVDKNFQTDDWAFHILMATFFFVNVVLMLNVLIALMNIAFGDADENGPLVWLDDRLRSVESAENIAYSAPGLRERFDWFPEYIYYTSSPRKVLAFQAKYPSSVSLPEPDHPGEDRSSHVVTPSTPRFTQYAETMTSGLSNDLPLPEQDQKSASVSNAAQEVEFTASVGLGSAGTTEVPYLFTESNITASPLSVSVSSPLSLSRYQAQSRQGSSYFAQAEPLVNSTSPTNAESPQFPQDKSSLRHTAFSERAHVSSNVFRSENDQDGDGVDDRFQPEPSITNEDEENDDSDYDARSRRQNQEQRGRLIEREVQATHENTKQLRQDVRTLEERLDRMTVMIELLLQQQQSQQQQ